MVGDMPLPCGLLDVNIYFFFFSSRRRHTRSLCDWSSDVCSSDLAVIKTLRVTALAQEIGGRIGAGEYVARAAQLAKADLMTAMVGEFPELQGTMGRYYAAAQGEPQEVALALEEHYRPCYAGDGLPSTKTGKALSLADKIDTLAG